MTRRVLITGAYGRAGSALARSLSSLDRPLTLVLSGRNAGRLDSLVETLSGSTEAVPLVGGLDEPARLAEQLKTGDIWINCAPWPEGIANLLADTVVRANIHYLDIQPAAEKRPAFRDALAGHPDSETRVALEAGVSPGAPALMANFLAQGLDGIHRLTLDVAMRDSAIPDAGLNDILVHLAEPAMHWRHGRWKKASPLAVRRRVADDGFRGAAAPAWMAELDEFARARGPQAMDCYYLAPSASAGLVLAFGYLTGLAARARGRRWLLPALRKRFARAGPPQGFALRGRITGEKDGETLQRETRLRFDDLYLATVAPITAAVGWLLDGGNLRSRLACFGNQLPADELLERLPGAHLEGYGAPGVVASQRRPV